MSSDQNVSLAMPAIRKAVEDPARIETERIELLPLQEDFRAYVMQYLSDPEVRHLMKLPVMDTLDKQNNWWLRFQSWRQNAQAVQWCGFRKQDKAYVCLLTLKEINWEERRAELGYSVLKGFYKQGYGREAAEAVRDYAFKIINLHTLFAQILPSNIGSQKIIKSLGFQEEGLFKDAHFYNGGYYDLLQFGQINPHHLRS